MVGWSSGHHIGVLRAGRPLRWGAKSLTLKIDCVEQPGCRSLDLQWKPGLSDDKKLRRWKLRGKGEKAGVEGAGCGFTFISSFFFMVCGYTKGVETQLLKLYLLVEFDEISKVAPCCLKATNSELLVGRGYRAHTYFVFKLDHL